MFRDVGVRHSTCLGCPFLLLYSNLVLFLLLDGEESDQSRNVSRICSPIQSEGEMVSEDMTDNGDETSDLSKYSLLISSLSFFFPVGFMS